MSPKGHPLIGIRQRASLPNSYGMVSKEESKWLRPLCTGPLHCGPVFLTRLPDSNLLVPLRSISWEGLSGISW